MCVLAGQRSFSKTTVYLTRGYFFLSVSSQFLANCYGKEEGMDGGKMEE